MNKNLIFAAFLLFPLCGCDNSGNAEKTVAGTPAQKTETLMKQEKKSQDQEKTSETIVRDGVKYIRVCTLSSARANEEFRRNVQVVQNQRQAALDAQAAGDNAAAEKILAKLNENNATMTKTYGYSILRDYLQQIVKTRIFVKLSDAEFAAAKADKAVAPDEFIENADGKFRLVATISGVRANDDFRGNVKLVQTQRAKLVKAYADLKKLSGAEAEKLKTAIDKAEKTLNENNAEMTRRYGFSLTRNYLMEIVESELFIRE